MDGYGWGEAIALQIVHRTTVWETHGMGDILGYARVWMSELIGMVLSAVNVITAKLLRLPFRKALAEHPFGEQRTQVPAARFLHRPL